MTETKERVRVPVTSQAAQQASANMLQLQKQADDMASLWRTIGEAATNPYCDAEKMKALHNLMVEIERNESRKAFIRAFNALQFELPAVRKDGKIDHSKDGGDRTRGGGKALKVMYSTYPNLMTVCRPLLRKHGFTFNNVIEPSPVVDGMMDVVGYLRHVLGHEQTTRFPVAPDGGPGRNAAQSRGSATSYGKRYNLILLLDIVSEAPQDQDDDDGAHRHGEQVEVINEDQVIQLREAIEGCGVPIDKVLVKYQITKITELPASRFGDAIAACKYYADQKNA